MANEAGSPAAQDLLPDIDTVSPSYPTESKPTRQSPNTCSACRARKVRCDGRRSICSNCDKYGYTCSFQNPDAARIPVRRRRAHVACLACHSRKIRCNEDRPSCRRCVRLGMFCVYPTLETATYLPRPGRKPSSTTTKQSSVPSMNVHDTCADTMLPPDETWQQGTSPSSPTSSTSAIVPLAAYPDSGLSEDRTRPIDSNFQVSVRNSLIDDTVIESVQQPGPPRQLALKALKFFFAHIHHIPVFAFLHQASVMDQYQNGVLDEALLLSLIGVVSVYHDLGSGMTESGTEYVATAEALVLRDMEKFSVSKVQALIFIIKHRIFRRRYASVFMLTAIAVRSAMGLRLNYEDPELSFLAQESCRRTMWSLYLIDSVMSAGYRDFTLSGSDLLHIQLPSHESNFDMDIPQATSYLQSPSQDVREKDLSNLALTMRIMFLRHRVLQFTKQAITSYQAGSEVGPGVDSLQAELNSYLTRLPAHLQLSKRNIKLYAHSSTLSNFLAIQITWHMAQCNLYRLTMEGLIEALPRHILGMLDPSFVKECQKRCFESAKSVANILCAVLSMDLDKIPLDLDIAVSIYQCLRILTHSHCTLNNVVSEPADAVNTLCHTCVEFLDTMIFDCEAVAAIRKDAHTLMEIASSHYQGTPGDLEPNDGNSSATGKQRSTNRHHILSKHSLVGQIEMPDKNKSFILSPSSAEAQPDPLHATLLSPNTSPGNDNDFTIGPAFFPALNTTNGQLNRLSDLGMPEFGLDSSISLFQPWFDVN